MLKSFSINNYNKMQCCVSIPSLSISIPDPGTMYHWYGGPYRAEDSDNDGGTPGAGPRPGLCV